MIIMITMIIPMIIMMIKLMMMMILMMKMIITMIMMMMSVLESQPKIPDNPVICRWYIYLIPVTYVVRPYKPNWSDMYAEYPRHNKLICGINYTAKKGFV